MLFIERDRLQVTALRSSDARVRSGARCDLRAVRELIDGLQRHLAQTGGALREGSDELTEGAA